MSSTQSYTLINGITVHNNTTSFSPGAVIPNQKRQYLFLLFTVFLLHLKKHTLFKGIKLCRTFARNMIHFERGCNTKI